MDDLETEEQSLVLLVGSICEHVEHIIIIQLPADWECGMAK